MLGNAMHFLTGIEPLGGGYEVSNGKIVQWDDVQVGRAQPAQQEIDDVLNNVTQVNGQTFSQWLASHGGDANLTRRRLGKEALDGLSADNALVRALALTIMDELNLLRAEHALAPRTGAQLRNAIKAKLDAGDADT